MACSLSMFYCADNCQLIFQPQKRVSDCINDRMIGERVIDISDNIYHSITVLVLKSFKNYINPVTALAISPILFLL